MRTCMKPSDLLEYALVKDKYAKQVLLGNENDYIDSPLLLEYLVLRLIGKNELKRAVEMSGLPYVNELDVFRISSPDDRETFLQEISGLSVAMKEYGL
jgi:hypothetical protein